MTGLLNRHKNILIVKFGALGDVVRTSYILQGLLEKYQGTKIFWLTSDSSFDLLRYNPYVDCLITPQINTEFLSGRVFDVVISLDDEVEILKKVNNISFKEIIGAFLNEKGFPIYDERSALWFDMGLISKYGKTKADLLKKKNKFSHNKIMEKMLGIKIRKPFFFNSSIIEMRVARLFDTTYFNIGLNSGAADRWISKQLPINETISLIKKLMSLRINRKEMKVYLLGSGSEKKRHSLILQTLKDINVFDTGSKNSLLELAAIIKCMNYVISSDSLALHLAISQGIPNLSFYAPTSANEIDTFGTGIKIKSLSKNYCNYKPDCDNSTITAKRIYNAMCKHLKLLKKNIKAC